MPATSIQTSVLERFLRYVTYDTQSQEGSDTYPSTLKQLVLLDQLASELRDLGLSDVERDAHGYVFGTIPATSKKSVPVIGFLAHVDTSPESPGAGVKPIVHRNWQGGDIVLPDDPSVILKPAEIPDLAAQVGNDTIPSSRIFAIRVARLLPGIGMPTRCASGRRPDRRASSSRCSE